MFPYGILPGYIPNPHHPRQAPTADTPLPTKRHVRARLDGGQWISGDGEWIYHFRFGDYWRAHWIDDGYGAWERSPEFPDGAVKL